MTHCDYVLIFSLCVLLAYDLCLSIFSVLDNFCQIAPLHRNALWMTRVLHLMCKAHTHILLFDSKFHIILAMYVQMLDRYTENIKKIEYIENSWYFRKYHNIFQPCNILIDKWSWGKLNIIYNVAPVTLQRCSWRTTSHVRGCLRSSALGRPAVGTRGAPCRNWTRRSTGTASSARIQWVVITWRGRVGWAPPATTPPW